MNPQSNDQAGPKTPPPWSQAASRQTRERGDYSRNCLSNIPFCFIQPSPWYPPVVDTPLSLTAPHFDVLSTTRKGGGEKITTHYFFQVFSTTQFHKYIFQSLPNMRHFIKFILAAPPSPILLDISFSQLYQICQNSSFFLWNLITVPPPLNLFLGRR